MTDDRNIVSRGPAQDTTIAHLLLHVRHHCTFRYRAQGQNIPNGQGSFLAGVDELPGVHALIGDEGFGVELEAVRVTELHFGQRCASTRIVNDVFDDTSNVTVFLREVERSELCWSLVQARMGRENGSTTFTLIPIRPSVSRPYLVYCSNS